MRKNKLFASRNSQISRGSQTPGIVFTLPLIIGLIVIFIPIFVKGIAFAFSNAVLDNGIILTFNGLDNFKYALRVDPNYITLLLENLRDLIVTLPIIIIFSLFVAVLLNTDVWGRGFFRALFFLPVIACTGLLASLDSGNAVMDVMSGAAQGGESTIINSISDVENILKSLRFSPELISIISESADKILDIVNRSGVQILIFLAGIQSISPSVYEAAKVEGAGAWEVFWKITLPMIFPMIGVNVLYTFLESITTENTSLVSYMSSLAFTKSEYGYSAAMAWFHCLMILLMIILVWLIYRIASYTARRLEVRN